MVIVVITGVALSIKAAFSCHNCNRLYSSFLNKQKTSTWIAREKKEMIHMVIVIITSINIVSKATNSCLKCNR